VPTTSFWLKEPCDDLPRSRFEGRAEVAVIGGGVTGCSCALTLAERGVRVRLYEAREIAGGASGRNGGFALRGAAVPYDDARRELGDERARLLVELTERDAAGGATLGQLTQIADRVFRFERSGGNKYHDAPAACPQWEDDPDGSCVRRHRRRLGGSRRRRRRRRAVPGRRG
jgi:glycine/D-amino acid oxidase-like deaminating enzyme